ncbi:MAG: hypothetical protein HYX75_01715 [Acidobacteria bacterium]|nr:hypothetical protein [Acidobacteriota bacterium]
MDTTYGRAITANARWFAVMEDSRGFIAVPADEYYGIEGDASLIGHAISVRTWGLKLSGDCALLKSALRSARWPAERQDERGGWHKLAGFSLDAAQCVFEGFCTYERMTGDKQFHKVMVRAADRMITGTVRDDGTLAIGNLTECGEYAHFAFLAWKQTGLERHRRGAEAILGVIMDNFDETEGYWNTAVEPEMNTVLRGVNPCLSPILRACVARMHLKGKTAAEIGEHMLPLVMNGRGPQYSLGMMDAESLLDTLDGTVDLPRLRAQTLCALDWVTKHCTGPMAGSLVESRKVPPGEEVYLLPAINDCENASLWPTSACLMAMVGINDPPRWGDPARVKADWRASMQDSDGGFFTHQDRAGRRFGQKFGNINFYASAALWEYQTHMIGEDPSRRS